MVTVSRGGHLHCITPFLPTASYSINETVTRNDEICPQSPDTASTNKQQLELCLEWQGILRAHDDSHLPGWMRGGDDAALRQATLSSRTLTETWQTCTQVSTLQTASGTRFQADIPMKFAF